MVNWQKEADRLVRRAISDARVVGSTFFLIGLLFCAIIAASSRGKPDAGHIIFFSATTLVLLGPGVLYHVAAYLLMKREAWAIRLCLYGGCAHLVMVALFLSLGMIRQLGARQLFIPAGVCLFLLPAMIAFIVHTYRARRAAEHLASSLPAFTPVMHHDGIDSDRAK